MIPPYASLTPPYTPNWRVRKWEQMGVRESKSYYSLPLFTLLLLLPNKSKEEYQLPLTSPYSSLLPIQIALRESRGNLPPPKYKPFTFIALQILL